jgi:hypothetical protein
MLKIHKAVTTVNATGVLRYKAWYAAETWSCLQLFDQNLMILDRRQTAKARDSLSWRGVAYNCSSQSTDISCYVYA